MPAAGRPRKAVKIVAVLPKKGLAARLSEFAKACKLD
jgi:hypothetical protein